MSRTVSAKGRHRNPASAARLESTRHAPGNVRHNGNSDHCRTPNATRTSSGAHTNSAEPPVTSRQAPSIPPNDSRPTGAATLKAPPIPRSTTRTTKSATSRTSTGCTDRPGSPGATTRPPAATRFSHHGSRPTYSLGPTTTPGRSTVARSPNTSTTARSHPAFWYPYRVGPSSTSTPNPALASAGHHNTSDPSDSARTGHPAYTLTLDTNTYRPTTPSNRRQTPNTSRGTYPDVSTTASQGPAPTSLSTSPTTPRSPRTTSTPATSPPLSPRLNTVTRHPLPTAAAATAHPTNRPPPKTKSRTHPSFRHPPPRGPPMPPHDLPLYERDPEAWQRHLAEGNAKQPRKRVGADALIRDDRERILLVDPTYKPDWDLPGGMAEANEPPHEALRRELHEELGLDLHIGAMLCVDWIAPHGPWDDTLMFIFDAGHLTPAQISAVHPTTSELSAHAFCSPAEASRRLRPYLWRRANAALQALTTSQPRYLTNGSTPGPP